MKSFSNRLLGKTVTITGASSGIGEACAYEFAKAGVNLKLIARREERLNNLKAKLLEFTKKENLDLGIDIYPKDLTARNGVDELAEAGALDCEILINNAGFALGKSSVAESDPTEWMKVFNLNCLAAFEVTQACLKSMLSHNGGDLVHIASIAGHQSYAGGAAYCASKSALRSFVKSLRKECLGKKIRPMLLSPGMVKTEFSLVRFQGDQKKADEVYEGIEAMIPRDIAEMALFMVSRPQHVCIDELLALSTDQADAETLFRRSHK